MKQSMKRKAIKTQSFLNSLDGVSCTDIDGAMYAFPKLELPKWFEDLASERGVQSDFLYDSLITHIKHTLRESRQSLQTTTGIAKNCLIVRVL